MAKKPNQELVRYIEEHLAKGFHIRHIKQKLAEVGHPIEAIEGAAQFVLAQKPHLKKKPKRFMIIYGIILILIIAAFVWFIWFKATQQIEYKETVEEIEEKKPFLGMTEVELLKFAAASNNLKACDFIKTHNLHYACVDRYWERDDCSYGRLVGEFEECRTDKAVTSLNHSLCHKISDRAAHSGCLNAVFAGISRKNAPENCRGDKRCLDFYLAQNKQNLDISFCDDYSRDEEKGACILNFSLFLNNGEFCDSIADANVFFDCKLNFISTPQEAADFCEENYFIVFELMEDDGSITADDKHAAKLQCFMTASQQLVVNRGYDCKQILDFTSSQTEPVFLRGFHKVYKDVKESVKDDDAAKLMECEV